MSVLSGNSTLCMWEAIRKRECRNFLILLFFDECIALMINSVLKIHEVDDCIDLKEQ